MHRPPLRLITTFGLGHCRPASGTWGSMPPVIVAGGLMLAGCGPATQPWVYYGVLVVMLLVFGAACIAQGPAAEARWGEDPSEVVADETSAQCLPLLAIPPGATLSLWHAALMLATAFLAFRILDIVKPWPADGLQRVPGGWGVLLDDLVAGLYACVPVLLVAHFALIA